MSYAPQSSPGLLRLPACAIVACLALADARRGPGGDGAHGARQPAQGARRRAAGVPPGRRAGRDRRGHGSWNEATVEGWIYTASTERTRRDGFDLVVTPDDGRESPPHAQRRRWSAGCGRGRCSSGSASKGTVDPGSAERLDSQEGRRDAGRAGQAAAQRPARCRHPGGARAARPRPPGRVARARRNRRAARGRDACRRRARRRSPPRPRAARWAPLQGGDPARVVGPLGRPGQGAGRGLGPGRRRRADRQRGAWSG